MRLPEVPEAEARGSVARAYEDIRDVVGLPLVNLVYRHLAVEPGRLEAVWAALRPNLADPAAAHAAGALASAAAVPLAPLSAAVLAAAGADGEELARVRATVDAYNHANPRNLLAVHALLAGVSQARRPPARPDGRTAVPPPPAELLPMASLDAVAPTARALLDETATAFTRPGDPALVPSLFRHFAHRPGLLAVLWTALRPLVDGRGLTRRADAVTARARSLAARLPHPVAAVEDAGTVRALESFAWTIARMLVAGASLRRALPGAPPAPR